MPVPDPPLDPEVCYRAIATRDPRFDGRFFTAVRTTGVYCRPICPARPKRENCMFLPCAAAAEELGYRPCLRCRPEASPGTPAWLGTSATVSRALRLIADGALDGADVETLAARVGVGGRHLRRLFVEHLGASPSAVAQSRRVLFAKKLIDETDLPMVQVAFSAGFASVRRFNDAIRSTYRRPPSELRRRRGRAGGASGEGEITLRLPYRAPLDWSGLVGYLALRAIPGVEEAEGNVYRRTFQVAGALGIVEVEPAPDEAILVARVRTDGPVPLIQVAERLRALFDLGADPSVIVAHLGRDPLLARLLDRRPGLRVPGTFTAFELAVRAIVGQQVSVKGATTLAGRIAQRCGRKLGGVAPSPGSGLAVAFPDANALCTADLGGLGLTGARVRTIRALAEAVAEGRLRLDLATGLDESVATLCELPGIGEWTAQYIAMRALREPDAFPHGDLGLRRALAPGEKPASAAMVRETAKAWRPWRAYAAVALWGSEAAAG